MKKKVYICFMDIERKNLIEEIHKLISEMDQENLIFIKEQSSVLIYNQKVRDRNAKAEKKNVEKKKKSNKKSKNVSDKKPTVYIEQLKNKKFFNICIQQEKLFMDYKEIITILKIARAAESPQLGAQRLYNWFKKERKDVLVDGYIGSSAHPALLMIYEELLDKFDLD